ncbi:hypothetical protein EC973_008120 [Apophysomyces ossiformis]|uniref:Uncharacterized protein n=1 Tax=Apophysomyces ossiformis TaxID=679940 RepID=A0A8H7BNR6_9FUNG|nr:hypothetical protein EC973_008120 [Apophysomyces ossiformis]
MDATNSCTQSCSTLSITTFPTPTSTNTMARTPIDNPEGLNETQIGAIIGGASAGILLVALAICLIVRSRRKKPKFQRGRGITPSMVFSQNTSSVTLDNSQQTPDRRSTYSFNTPNNAFGSQNYTPSKPSEKTTAQLDELYNIKQYNVQPRPRNDDPVTRASQAGARLSKYNYLAQAFSQMRASYAANEPKLVLPEPVHHHNSLHPQEMSYTGSNSSFLTPMSSSLSPSPAQQQKPTSTTTHTLTPNTTPSNTSSNASPREIELSSLNGDTSSQPPRIMISNEHNEHEEIIDSYRHHTRSEIRDSVTSDVSQYSTFSTSSNPYHFAMDPSKRRIHDLKPPTSSNGRHYNYF